MRTSQYTISAIIALLILQVKVTYIDEPVMELHEENIKKQQERIVNQSPFEMNYMPSQNVLMRLTVGFEQILSDYYWIKAVTIGAVDLMHKYNISPDSQNAIEIIEHTGMSDRQQRLLYELIRISTAYDPYFIYAYEYGSLLLAWEGYTDLSIYILKGGLKSNPGSARLYNSLSFMYYFFLKDFSNGAYYAERAFEAAGEDGDYSNPKLVAQVYAAGGDYEAALKFLKDLLDKPQTQMTRGQIETMSRYIRVERDIEYLEKALGAFIKKYNVRPLELRGLVDTRLINGIPPEPFGGHYVLNTKTWKVENVPAVRYEHLHTISTRRTSAFTVKRALPSHADEDKDHEHEENHEDHEDHEE